jgi:hypothetical protein
VAALALGAAALVSGPALWLARRPRISLSQ